MVLFGAGVLKLMDPVGAGLVMHGYLNFFGMQALWPAENILGAGMALLEAVMGAAVLTGIQRKFVSIASLVLLSFFTILTAILVVADPKMDCGCFGEAIHLTHKQTLIKNIVLMALWAIAYLPFRKQEPSRKIKYATFCIATISVLLFLFYSSMAIPMVDFTKYKPGAELMLSDELDFGDDKTPTLSFCGVDGEYKDSLALIEKVVVVSIYDPAKVTAERWQKIERFTIDADAAGITPLILTVSTPEEITSYVNSPVILSSVFFADRKELIALNRSNGGASYIDDGQIVVKWSKYKLPRKNKLLQLSQTNSTEALVTENSNPRLKIQGFMLFLFALMVLF